MSFRNIASLLTLAVCVPAFAQAPSTYQDLYTSLNSQLTTFSQTVHSNWNGTPYPTLYSSQLNTANSENETLLLTPSHYANVLTQMNELQALGVHAVTVHINFPILYSPYYASNPATYQQYLSFYTQLAGDVRARGLKLIVETQVEKSSDAALNTWLKGLSWANYQAGRAQTASVIAQNLRPDYMTVITEPDTEALSSGQALAGTIPGSLQMLQTILTALKGSSVAAGAGAGTWLPNFAQFMQAYGATSVHFLDMHIYPINRTYLSNALVGADIAKAAGKPVTISEAWMYKVRDSELATASPTQLYSRDVFSFWAPLDAQFLRAIHDLACYKQFAVVSPFWSQYFFAYLDYTANSSAAPAQLSTLAVSQAAAANATGSFTSTGLAFENDSLLTPDKTAPLVPPAPAATPMAGAVELTWTATTDNVGVAGYKVFRNGTQLAATSNLKYTDRSGSTGTKYTYTLAAFDAAGNNSPVSASAMAARK